MALAFGEHNDVIFKKAPLVTVLAVIRFEPVLSLMSEVGIVGFQEGIRSRYPHFSNKESGEIQIENQQPNVRNINVRKVPPVWMMQDESNRWRVSLAADFIGFQTLTYRNFDEFLERLMDILAVLDRTVHVSNSTRIGLRKINILTHPNISSPQDWKELLRPELLGIAGIEHPGQLSNHRSTTSIKDGHAQFTIISGPICKTESEFIKNSLQLTPAAKSESLGSETNESLVDILFDLDYGTIAPCRVGNGEEISKVLKEFSSGITSFFHWSITQKYYDWLEPELRDIKNEK